MKPYLLALVICISLTGCAVLPRFSGKVTGADGSVLSVEHNPPKITVKP